jgi:hypothetical protein
MIRPILTELALLLAPFAVYALFLWVTKSGVFEWESWSPKVVIALTGVAIVLMLGSFIVFAHFSGAPPGSEYFPAHIEDGRLVPGEVR